MTVDVISVGTTQVLPIAIGVSVLIAALMGAAWLNDWMKQRR